MLRRFGISDAASSAGNSSVAMMWLAIGTTRRRNAGVTPPAYPLVAMTTSPATSGAAGGSPTRPIRGNLFDRRLGADRDAPPPTRLKQPFVIERRMQARRALDDHAAMVIVARDLLALPVARDHIGAGLRRVVEPREPLLLPRVMLWRPQIG